MKKILLCVIVCLIGGVSFGQNHQKYVDLGLPSGVMWKSTNEGGICHFNDAIRKYGSDLPTKEEWEELKKSCKWEWYKEGYKVIGPNGNYIYLPADGYRDCNSTEIKNIGTTGAYWSSTTEDRYAWYIAFWSSYDNVPAGSALNYRSRCEGKSIRLVSRP